MFEQRIETVMSHLAERGLSQLLVCDPRSIQYLTGFFVEPDERFLGLLLAKNSAPTLLLNKLFPLTVELPCPLRSFTDTDDPLALVAELCSLFGRKKKKQEEESLQSQTETN